MARGKDNCEFSVKDGIMTGGDGLQYITTACSCVGAREVKGKGVLSTNTVSLLRKGVAASINVVAAVTQVPGEMMKRLASPSTRSKEELKQEQRRREARRSWEYRQRGVRRSEAYRREARRGRSTAMPRYRSATSEPIASFGSIGHHDKEVAEMLGVPWLGKDEEEQEKETVVGHHVKEIAEMLGVPWLGSDEEPVLTGAGAVPATLDDVMTDIIDAPSRLVDATSRGIYNAGDFMTTRIDSFMDSVWETIGSDHEYSNFKFYLPDCVLDAWSSTGKINVQWNGLASVEVLESLSNVKELDARHNNIDKFPDITRMKNLEKLDLRWNDDIPALTCMDKTYRNLKFGKKEIELIRRCQLDGTLGDERRGDRTLVKIGDGLSKAGEIVGEIAVGLLSVL